MGRGCQWVRGCRRDSCLPLGVSGPSQGGRHGPGAALPHRFPGRPSWGWAGERRARHKLEQVNCQGLRFNAAYLCTCLGLRTRSPRSPLVRESSAPSVPEAWVLQGRQNFCLYTETSASVHRQNAPPSLTHPPEHHVHRGVLTTSPAVLTPDQPGAWRHGPALLLASDGDTAL